jgi:hypothetical protein
MIKENILRRILYIGAGLVILATVLFPIASILYFILDKTGHATPEKSIIPMLVGLILRLLILFAFREAIIVNKRNERLENVFFVLSGIGLIVFGLLELKMAIEFLGFHNYYVSTIALLFCVGSDFIAAVIAFTALFLQPK